MKSKPFAMKFKTQLCRHYEKGKCERGSKCRFAHGDIEKSEKKLFKSFNFFNDAESLAINNKQNIHEKSQLNPDCIFFDNIPEGEKLQIFDFKKTKNVINISDKEKNQAKFRYEKVSEAPSKASEKSKKEYISDKVQALVIQHSSLVCNENDITKKFIETKTNLNSGFLADCNPKIKPLNPCVNNKPKNSNLNNKENNAHFNKLKYQILFKQIQDANGDESESADDTLITGDLIKIFPNIRRALYDNDDE